METFALAEDQQDARARATRLFERVRAELERALPAGCEVLHVGATSIDGCLTKGDLDLVVRCEQPDFEQADKILAERFDRNSGSVRTATFSAFEHHGTAPEMGVQLTTKGGDLDVFHLFASALRRDPDLVTRYNALKRSYEGRPMDDYRTAKSAFVSSVLNKGSKRG